MTSRIKDISRAALYAWLSIPEYWMVDLTSAIVGAYREPMSSQKDDSKYRWFRSYGRNEIITSSTVENLIVETNFLLELSQTERQQSHTAIDSILPSK